MERHVSTSQRRIDEQENQIALLRQEKADLEMALSQSAIDKQKVKHRYNAKVAMETEKLSQELEKKLERDRQHLRVSCCTFSLFWLRL